jgi:hypothetical protein
MIPLLLACVLASARSVAASAVAADAPRPGQVVTKVAPPEVLTRVRPSIPPAAANGLWDETAIVSAQIGDDGRVKGVRIIRSVPQLDAAVCAAVQ